MAKEKGRPGMMLYFDTFAVMRKYLTPIELASAICQLVDYAEQGIEPVDLPQAAAMAFDLLKPRIDHDADAYEDKVRSSRYAAFVKKCKAEGIKDYPSSEEWDGTMKLPKRKHTDVNERTHPLTDVNERTPTQTSVNQNRNRNRNLNRNRNTTEIEIEREIEIEGGSRRNSAAADAADVETKVLKWADADDELREEVATLTTDIFTEYVPGRLPQKADALKMFERVCSVDADGRGYVDAEKEQLVREAFAHAAEEGKPGNAVAVYHYLKEASA